jgi:hypothetical protein
MGSNWVEVKVIIFFQKLYLLRLHCVSVLIVDVCECVCPHIRCAHTHIWVSHAQTFRPTLRYIPCLL